MQLINTTAIVTGGASGLGAATAVALVKAGATVFALDLAQAINKAPGIKGVKYLPTDVTSGDQVRQAVQTATSSDAPLRTVVNCAGIGPSARILGRSGTHDLELFARIVQINLCGTFNVLAVAAEAIAQTDDDKNGQRGVIINTASVAAFDGQVGQAAYSSSKGGIAALPSPQPETSHNTESASAPSPPESSTPPCWPPSAKSSVPTSPQASPSRNGLAALTNTPN